jgi:hypothetical protein
VFEKRLVKGMFGFRNEVTGQQRKLHTEDLYNVHYSPNIVRTSESQRMKLAGYRAHMRRLEMFTKSLSERLKGGRHPEELVIGGEIKLN